MLTAPICYKTTFLVQQMGVADASRLPLPLISDLAVSSSYKLLQELTKPKVSGGAGRMHQGALGRSPRGGSEDVQLPMPSGAEPSQDCSPQRAPGLGWRDPARVDLLHHHVRPSPLPQPGWKWGSGQPALPLPQLCLNSCHRKDLITETTSAVEKDKPPALCQPPTTSGGAGSHLWSPAQQAAQPTVAVARIMSSRPCVINWLGEASLFPGSFLARSSCRYSCRKPASLS